MKNENMLLIDRGYTLLEEFTDKELAKELFEKYLLQDVPVLFEQNVKANKDIIKRIDNIQ